MGSAEDKNVLSSLAYIKRQNENIEDFHKELKAMKEAIITLTSRVEHLEKSNYKDLVKNFRGGPTVVED